MSNILFINSSPRGERSRSRSLVNEFLSLRAQQHPAETVIHRDIYTEPVPFVSEAWVVGAFAPEEYQTPESRAAMAVSNTLVDEFLAADRYVFGVPMYNLNIPAAFKAYIDQIVRPGRTFAIGPNGYEGLVHGKKALFVTASGGSFPAGSPMAAYNFQEPYLRAIFGFMGVTDIEFVIADSQSLGEDAAAASNAKAREQLKTLVTNW